jgi:tetratricopeptide (TPR) repeat protein
MTVPKKTTKHRRLAGIIFGCLCVSLAILLIKQTFRDSHPPSVTREAETQTAVSASGTDTPTANRAGSVTDQLSLQDSEDRVVALTTEGNQFLSQGDYAEAVKKFEQAVAISPDQEDLHYNLAIALAGLGKTAEAKKHYEEALRIFPEYAEAHNNLGNLLMNESKLEEAIGRFREAIKYSPENASFHNNLGSAFGRRGKVAEAIGEFEEAIKRSPTYVEARVNLANAFLSTGRVEDAIGQLDEALRLKPGFTPALQTMQRAKQRQAAVKAEK